MTSSSIADFNGLPEDCIANILSFTTPADVCRLSLVSSTFHSAADSDFVWERLLPADYVSIVSRSERFQQRVSLSSKKQLYMSLCDDPLIIDDGTKSFFLDKWSGKKCYMMASRNLLNILGSSQMQSVIWIPLSGSRFKENAYIFSLCCLEIHGNINTSILSPNTTYRAYLVFKLWPGIEHRRVRALVTTKGGKHRTDQIVFFHAKREEMEEKFVVSWSGLKPLVLLRKSRDGLQGAENGKFAKGRRDGWLEIEIGEFIGGGDDEVGLCVAEMDGGQFEGGCVIQGIEVRPVDALRLSS